MPAHRDRGKTSVLDWWLTRWHAGEGPIGDTMMLLAISRSQLVGHRFPSRQRSPLNKSLNVESLLSLPMPSLLIFRVFIPWSRVGRGCYPFASLQLGNLASLSPASFFLFNAYVASTRTKPFRVRVSANVNIMALALWQVTNKVQMGRVQHVITPLSSYHDLDRSWVSESDGFVSRLGTGSTRFAASTSTSRPESEGDTLMGRRDNSL